MQEEELKNWELAGKIAAEARDYAKNLVKKDKSLLEVTEKIEEKIFQLNGKPAFPVQISLNEIAAHYNALVNDSTIFKEDLVKVDLGVHVNGCIGDTAITIDLTNENKRLVEAAEKALHNALEIVKENISINEIGNLIQRTITSYNFSPIRNLSGHGLNKFVIHDKPTIPNYDNNDKTKLIKNQVIAIEPFATKGVGLTIEGKPSEIFQLINKKPVRDNNARKILNFVEQEYKELPFAKRWLLKHFSPFQVSIGLKVLERENILHQFAQLPEKSKNLVSQAEHTILIGEKIKILTKV